LNRLLNSATIPKLTNADVHSKNDTNYGHVDVPGKIENMPLLIPLTEVDKHKNELVTTTGKVYSYKDIKSIVLEWLLKSGERL